MAKVQQKYAYDEETKPFTVNTAEQNQIDVIDLTGPIKACQNRET